MSNVMLGCSSVKACVSASVWETVTSVLSISSVTRHVLAAALVGGRGGLVTRRSVHPLVLGCALLGVVVSRTRRRAG